MKKLAFALAALAFQMSSAHAASFNCNYAKLPVEVAICQDTNLGELDESMARRYFQLKSRAPRHIFRQVKREQKTWIKARNRCGYDDYCIVAQYTVRIRRLRNLLEDY